MCPDRLAMGPALLIASLASLAPSGPANAQGTAPASDSVKKILAERIERGGGVGLVAGLIEQGRPRVVAAGRRAGQGSAPVDAGTVFEIGSVSKVFTTTLLAEMVVRGEVALDDPIGRFLPDSVPAPSRNGREITLLDLATASSGLPRLPTGFTPADIANPYADYDEPKLYAFLRAYTLPRDPGTLYEYSNLGMGLLGHLLARRAGMTYEALVRERILHPLGMRETVIGLTPELRARLAAGHNADLDPVANWDIDVLAGAGAWRSTMNDMLRFLAAAMAPPEGSLGEAFRMAMEPRRPAGNPMLSIGLGWHVRERDGRRIVWHNGQTGGYHAFLGFDPATGANALVLANAAVSVDDIGVHLIDPASPLRPLAPSRPSITVAEAVLDRYVGRYEVSPDFAIDITREGQSLFVQGTGQPRVRMFAASPERFFLRVVEAEVEFTTDETGTVSGLILHQGGRAMPGRRVR